MGSQADCQKTLEDIYNLFEQFGNLLGTMLTKIAGIAIDSDTTIVSIAVTLTTCFFAMEVFSQLAQFRVDRIEEAIKVAMKFVVAKIIVENTSAIAGGIMGFIHLSDEKAFDSSLNAISAFLGSVTVSTIEDGGGIFGIGYFVLTLFLSLFGCAMIFLLISIIISLIGIYFELIIHYIISPIALSTLVNDMTRPTGITFIKSFIAVALQLTVINAMLQAFTTIIAPLTSIDYSTISTGSNYLSTMVGFLIPFACVIALNKGIKSSSDITKRMLGA